MMREGGSALGDGVGVGIAAAFDEAALRDLGRVWREPGWMTESRFAALAAFDRLALPGPTDEAWRRTPPENLAWDGLRPASQEAAEVGFPREARQALETEPARAGAVLNRNGAPALTSLDDSIRRRGVIFTDLRSAVSNHGDLVRAHMGHTVRPEESKFAAQHAAFVSGGVFLYVPRGVEVELPLQVVEWIDAGRVAVFPHVLIVAEPGSRVTLVQHWLSATEAEALVNAAVEVVCGDGAQVRYVSVQEFGPNIREMGILRARIGRDATLRSLVVGFGARLSKIFVESYLGGPGGSSEMLGMFFTDGTQHYDAHTLQEHLAPHTTSDLLYKNALRETARTVFAGMIRVHPGGQRTNAFQSNRNLLLSSDAKADSKPELEIMANDLRCTHGSAISRLDEQHLFYLQTRGLSRRQAIHMIVEGFFAEVLDRLPLEGVRQAIEQRIAHKMGAQAPLGRVTALRGLLEEAARVR
jgi:Fe-S cluster assembly protein SufD